jgi:hypothetical protein
MTRNNCLTTIVGLLCCVASTQASANDSPDASEFRARFHALMATSPQQIGRERLVKKYEELMQEFAEPDQVAEVALYVAGLYELNDLKYDDIRPDREKALAWCGIAANSATPESPLWCEANIKYAQRVGAPLTPDALEKARAVYVATLPKCVSTLHRMRAVQGMYSVSLCEGKLDVAATLCRSLLHDDFSDPTHKLTKSEKDQVEAIKIGTVGSLIQRWGNERIDPAENEKRIRQLRAELPNAPALDISMELALKSVAQNKTPVLDQDPRLQDLSMGTRKWLMIFNFLCIAVIGGVYWFRRSKNP